MRKFSADSQKHNQVQKVLSQVEEHLQTHGLNNNDLLAWALERLNLLQDDGETASLLLPEFWEE